MEALLAWIDAWLDGNPPANVWLGSTVVNQAEADRDVPQLLAVPARVRFLSIEPMLGPITVPIGQVMTGFPQHIDHRGNAHGAPLALHWIIAGGESGPHARPMHPDWLRSLRDQCEAAGVPFLFKQWGEYAPNWFYMEDGKTEQPGTMWMDRMGKKIAGRKLDGRTHDGFPVGQG